MRKMRAKNTLKNTARKILYGLTLIGMLATPSHTYNAQSAFSPKPAYSQTQTPDSAQAEPRHSRSSLEQLARQGLPEEFKKMGFTLGDYVNRGTDKEVIIIAEYHFTPGLKEKQGKLIKFLTEKYQIDSLGHEGCTGTSPELYTPEKKNQERLKEVLREFNEQGVNIPVFGIEDKQLVELSYLLGKEECSEIKSKKQEIIKRIRDIGFSEDFIKTNIYFDSKGNLDNLRNMIVLEEDIRNRSFSKNVQKYMDNKGYKRSIVIVGAGHSIFPYPELKNFQDSLPYSYLIVYSPEISRDFIKEAMDMEAKKNGMDNKTFRKEIERVLAR